MVKNKNGEIKLSAKEKLLKYLIENKNPQSILTASGAIVVDYKNTYNLVNKFEPDVISKEKIGNTNLIKIRLVPNQEILSIENKRTAQFLKANKQLKLVKKDIENVNYPFLVVLVFGSYVKKTQTKKSDIDLCIISDNIEESKRLISKLELLPIKLEIHTFATKEFESMLKTKEDNVGKEIVKNNIILYGTENYYNLISKWMKKE
ncbi:MAG: nucleotidyltransferase domain-containing protein [Nanoarchaeota archaeon]